MIDTDVSIGSTIRFDPSNASAPLYEVTVSRLTPNGTTRTPQGLPVFQIASGRVGSKTIRGLAPGAYQISVHFNDGGLEQIESAMIAIRDDEEVVFPLP
jgi:hypothetical protein